MKLCVNALSPSEISEVKGWEIPKLLCGVSWISSVFFSPAAKRFTTPEWRVGYKYCSFIWISVAFSLQIQLQFVVVTYSIHFSMCFAVFVGIVLDLYYMLPWSIKFPSCVV